MNLNSDQQPSLNRDDGGFTLIELLVIISIIGLLAAIALPAFEAYRADAYDSVAFTDLRAFMSAEEAYFADFETYTNKATLEATLSVADSGTETTITSLGSTWFGQAYHLQGGHTYCYDSATDRRIRRLDGVGTACS